MSKTKSNIANEDSPSSLAEAEKLYPHIGKSVKKFTAMLMTTVPWLNMESTADPSTFDDPQYMLLGKDWRL